ncbi:unnamed protein product [Lota lota]
MPYGKIVVIKRGGGDGTEFPLTATCLFGRKPDCDIRIQLPHVSKEHCRVELNENKEVILTNMSSVNPTRVNGEELQQAERLKHGDVITIIDRSFRFEYPPQQTPKKFSVSGKADTQVLHEHLRTPGENRTSEISTGPRLKDGANNDNIQRSLEKTMEVESKEDGSLQHSKTDSPFNDLYQMIKHSLETPRKPAGHQPQTPATKNATPKPQPGLITKVVVQAAAAADTVSTPSKDEIKSQVVAPAKSPKKFRKSLDTIATPVAAEKASKQQTPKTAPPTEETPKKKRLSLLAQTPSTMKASATPKEETPQEVIASKEVVQQVAVEKPKTATPVKPTAEEQLDPTEAACATPTAAPVKPSPRVSPRKKKASKKRESEAAAIPRTMRKRVSFGGLLSPELFDKRLPPSSPLQKGATPRRSLSVAKPKQSLLRRASATGLIKEFDEAKSLKAKSPVNKSPKAKTPSPARKSPKVKTASPKTPSSVKKSPKAKSDTPMNDQTPTVTGRFSVSCISTPSPVTKQETVTRKVPLRRKTISRKTPKSALKNVAEVLRRRSGVSRASLKVVNSWVDIVKFGQTKPQVIAPSKSLAATQKVKKAVVAQPKTPARKCLEGHVTTGHADSPVTIVVGKAFNQRAVTHAGAAPKLVHNIALLKKNMKMDEDLTGIAEIFSTPVNARKRKSELLVKTPPGALSTSAVEMSVMNTPEETGEMVVSPLVVSSTTKRSAFNMEAVQRLLQSEEGSSFNGGAPALGDPVQASCQEVNTKEAPPKQEPAQRIVRTPKQKAEPIEDLRGKLKTPKQKPQQPDCLSGVKRIMKTPRQKSDPIEDLRGKLLKTPKQKPQQPDCLSGVKRIMKTPRQKASGEVNLDGVKQLLETPKQRGEPVSVVPEVVVEETLATSEETITPVKEVVVEETLATSEETITPVKEVVVEETALATPEETITPVKEVVVEETALATPEETITPVKEVVVEETALATPEETITPVDKMIVEETITPVVEVGVEETLATPDETIAPVVEVGVEGTLATPDETITPVVEVGVEETLATPEETITAVVEVGVEETLATPDETITAVVEVVFEDTPVDDETVADKPTEDTGDQHGEPAVIESDMATASKVLCEEPQEDGPCAQSEDGPADSIEEVSQADMATGLVSSDAPAGEPEHTVAMETAPQEVAGRSLPETQPTEKETVIPAVQDSALPAPAPLSKSVRGKAKATKHVTDKDPTLEEPTAPIRGRRGRPTQKTLAPPQAEEQTPARSRRGRLTVSKNVKEPVVTSLPEEAPEETSLKPRRGRNAKPEITTTEETSDQAPPTDAVKSDTTAIPPSVKTQTRKGKNPKQVAEQPTVVPQPEEEPVPAVRVEKPRRGRKALQQEPQVEMVQEEGGEVVADKAPPTGAQPEEQAPVTVKPRRGRKAIQEAAPEPEAVVVEQVVTEEPTQAPVRAKRGRATKAKPEEKVEAEVDIPVVPEAVVKQATEKSRRTKTKQESVEEAASEELKVVESSAPEKLRAPVAPSKTRGRKSKVEEAPETLRAPVAPSKTRGRKSKVEEVEEAPETVVKSMRGKRAAVTGPPVAPVKRVRRGAMEPPHETAVVEPMAAVSQLGARGRAGKRSTVETPDVPVEVPAEPATKGRKEEEEKIQPKKGRVSKKTKSTPKDQESLTTGEDEKTSKSVNWKDDLAVVCEIPTPTPVLKATRGRKAAVAAPVIVAKRKVSRGQSKAEEDLSEVSQPVKRTRKGTKVL